MQEQNFKNHAKVVPGFLVAAVLIIMALVLAVIMVVQSRFSLISIFMLLVAVALVMLWMFVRSFATGNQDRIIRAEENFRNYRQYGKLADSRLTNGQIIALRFASDDEYPALVEKAIKENLSPADIKKEIQQWQADHHRI